MAQLGIHVECAAAVPTFEAICMYVASRAVYMFGWSTPNGPARAAGLLRAHAQCAAAPPSSAACSHALCYHIRHSSPHLGANHIQKMWRLRSQCCCQPMRSSAALLSCIYACAVSLLETLISTCGYTSLTEDVQVAKPGLLSCCNICHNAQQGFLAQLHVAEVLSVLQS